MMPEVKFNTHQRHLEHAAICRPHMQRAFARIHDCTVQSCWKCYGSQERACAGRELSFTHRAGSSPSCSCIVLSRTPKTKMRVGIHANSQIAGYRVALRARNEMFAKAGADPHPRPCCTSCIDGLGMLSQPQGPCLCHSTCL